ncbi:hypothetical protein SAMN05421505_14930 [Sinosporangium album]|uniref:HK97 gp10 family phage protein n=1 Tax=Sinosporangium album TaxID=504805 RepID=A0A1G8KCE7_9ACTN|nr:DUF5403 family protein [Sinosporangium album]SDI41081.1 hypothetical protein SAMN05421505_14930 [Sinosporangium album]
MAQVYAGINRIVSREPGVKAAVRAKAEEIGGRGRAFLAAHRDTGAAAVEVTSGRVDSVVSLVDPNALSIEYGHAAYTRKDGREVGASQGLYVIHRAAGLQ